MTEQRNTPDSAAETDPLVTQAYREMADERAPEHLNRKILKESASAARPRYSRFIAWTRPLAWAATVMLSVVLVLEVTRVPNSTPVIFEPAPGAIELRKLESDLTDDAPAESLEESTVPATPPGRTANGAAVAAPEAATAYSAAKQSAPVGPEKEHRDDLRQSPQPVQTMTSPATAMDEFKRKDADMLRRAEEMARLQGGENREAGLANSATVAADTTSTELGVATMSVATAGCDESVTRSPQTWFECIVDLEDAGLADEARRQRELLREAFPDFEPR